MNADPSSCTVLCGERRSESKGPEVYMQLARGLNQIGYGLNAV